MFHYDAENDACIPAQVEEDTLGYRTPGGRLIVPVVKPCVALKDLDLPESDVHWSACYGGWIIFYTCVAFPDKVKGVRWGVVLYESTDDGESFHFLSKVLYDPVLDLSKDLHWAYRSGYSEIALTIQPDGDMLMLLRTEEEIPGPLYHVRSKDGGRTWSEQTVFEKRGVLPHLLTLKNGVTVLVTGRPGQFMRATESADCSEWGPLEILVQPYPEGYVFDFEQAMVGGFHPMGTTCANANILPLGDDSFLVAYSDFLLSQRKGRKGQDHPHPPRARDQGVITWTVT